MARLSDVPQLSTTTPRLGGRDVHIYPSDFRFASRILRITKWLSEQNVFSVIDLIGINEGCLPPNERIDDRRTIYRFSMSRQLRRRGSLFRGIAFIRWYLSVLQFYLRKDIGCINSHSLSVLALGIMLSLLKRKPLIYEPHELETEVGEAKGLRRIIAKLVERSMIRFADQVVTVSPGISRWYEQTYRLPHVWVIRNLTETQRAASISEKYFHRMHGIDPCEIVFLYQGGLQHGRGIDIILAAAQSLPADKHVVFMGDGSLIAAVKAAAASYGNIHYHEPVQPSHLCRYTAAADVGVILTEANCLNHVLCFPNKLSEYLSSGLPVLLSSGLDIADAVRAYDCGWSCHPSPDHFIETVSAIDREAVESKREKALCWASANTWCSETKTLGALYSSVAKKFGDPCRRLQAEC